MSIAVKVQCKGRFACGCKNKPGKAVEESAFSQHCHFNKETRVRMQEPGSWQQAVSSRK
jgi:hypothetical protein